MKHKPFTRLLAISLCAALTLASTPKVDANTALLPIVASTPPGFVVVGVVVVLGVSYYLLTHRRTGKKVLAPIRTGDHENKPGVQETHGVTSAGQCDQMAEKFRRQGRKVTLKRKVRNDSGGLLTWICVFEGPDAQIGYYRDNRH
jgi:hypothetical protein